MELSKQVASLEQAKKLEELGVDAESAFYWRFPTNKWIIEPKGYFHEEEEGVEWLPAYNSSELSKVLKEYFPYWIAIWSEWGFKETGGTPRGYENLAHAAAACLINRIENGKISPEEVNNRLKNA